jgi:glucans biosynthesis protein C
MREYSTQKPIAGGLNYVPVGAGLPPIALWGIALGAQLGCRTPTGYARWAAPKTSPSLRDSGEAAYRSVTTSMYAPVSALAARSSAAKSYYIAQSRVWLACENGDARASWLAAIFPAADGNLVGVSVVQSENRVTRPKARALEGSVATTSLERPTPQVSRAHSRDFSVDYLRTTLTLMVLAHHSSLAYTTFAHFDKENIARSTAPVVDATRWIFLDYAENFNDVFFMSLMFFVSGLFVLPALRRHGTGAFLWDRFLRLGLPFAGAVLLLMPVAYYPSWQLAGHNSGFIDFYKRLATHGFAAGPPWFIWVLLFFDVVLALTLLPLQRYIPAAARFLLRFKERPVVLFAAVFVLAAVTYLPLLSRYGFGTWTNLLTSPFSFQISRFALYAMWFVFGFLVGAAGIQEGLLSRDGALARHWRLWTLGCVVAYNALWFAPRWISAEQWLSRFELGSLEALLWVASCVASCFGFLALFRGAQLHTTAWMNSLSRSAYVMYLVHYVYVTWTQKALLGIPIHASIKFLIVFLTVTLLSWLSAQFLLRIPGLNRIL